MDLKKLDIDMVNLLCAFFDHHMDKPLPTSDLVIALGRDGPLHPLAYVHLLHRRPFAIRSQNVDVEAAERLGSRNEIRPVVSHHLRIQIQFVHQIIPFQVCWNNNKKNKNWEFSTERCYWSFVITS